MRVFFGPYHRFTQAECCTSLYDRGKYFYGESFRRIVERGVAGARHMSVGRFLSDEAYPDSWSYLPWTFIEPECADIIDAWEVLRGIVETLGMEGMLPPSAHVRYSGNKSFWLCLPSGSCGNPIATVTDQKTLRRRVFLPLLDAPVDENLWDGRHLARLVGSQHEKGSQVRSWPVSLFHSLPLCRLLETPSRREPNPSKSIPCPSLLNRFKDKAVFHVPPMDAVARSTEGMGFVKTILEGVEEGDRNFASYRYGCYLLRRKSEAEAWDTLLSWNTKNTPPLPVRELKNTFISAQRTYERTESHIRPQGRVLPGCRISPQDAGIPGPQYHRSAP